MRPNWVKMRPEDPHFVCAQLGHDGRVRGTPGDCNPFQLVVVVCKIHQDRTNKQETLNHIAFLVVQDSSIGDIVSQSVSQSVSERLLSDF